MADPNPNKAPAFTTTKGKVENQSSAKRVSSPPGFQPIDDFEKEQEELDRQLGATRALQSPKKKVKSGRVLDPEVKAAEESAVREIGDINWVGRLHEYRQAHPVPGEGCEFNETSNDNAHLPRFTCSVTIHEAIGQEFGSNTSFAVKKTAKKYAAKKAIDWLIEHNRMPANGSARFPKPKQASQQVTPQKARLVSTTSSSPSGGSDSPAPTIPYTTQVPELCIKLGFSVPRYEITQIASSSPICSAYADFTGEPSISSKVGEVKNIYGKKNAKEECARGVVLFLRDIEKRRLAESKDEDRSRRRSLSSED